jgi:hypothetical protein
MRAEVADVLTVYYLVHNEQSEAVELKIRAAQADAEADAGTP